MIRFSGREFSNHQRLRVDGDRSVRIVIAADSPISRLAAVDRFKFVKPTSSNMSRGLIANEANEQVRMTIHQGVVIAAHIGWSYPSASLPFGVQVFPSGAFLLGIGDRKPHVIFDLVADAALVDEGIASWCGGLVSALEHFHALVFGDDRLHDVARFLR